MWYSCVLENFSCERPRYCGACILISSRGSCLVILIEVHHKVNPFVFFLLCGLPEIQMAELFISAVRSNNRSNILLFFNFFLVRWLRLNFSSWPSEGYRIGTQSWRACDIVKLCSLKCQILDKSWCCNN